MAHCSLTLQFPSVRWKVEDSKWKQQAPLLEGCRVRPGLLWRGHVLAAGRWGTGRKTIRSKFPYQTYPNTHYNQLFTLKLSIVCPFCVWNPGNGKPLQVYTKWESAAQRPFSPAWRGFLCIQKKLKGVIEKVVCVLLLLLFLTFSPS